MKEILNVYNLRTTNAIPVEIFTGLGKLIDCKSAWFVSYFVLYYVECPSCFHLLLFTNFIQTLLIDKYLTWILLTEILRLKDFLLKTTHLGISSVCVMCVFYHL